MEFPPARALAGWSFVLALRRTIGCMLLASSALTAAALVPACAQGRLEARYQVTLAGIQIGKGNWVVEINGTHYSAATSGVTIDDGKVKDFKADPPPDKLGERVPITEEQRHGVLDPLTASLMHAPRTGKVLVPEACQRTLAIFDGRLRYDLQLAFKRMDQVKAEKGYAGPVVVCAVYFSPIGGYIPSAATIKYIAKLRDMEIWLAPVTGTRVLVPFRAQGPTPIGQAVLEAKQFVSVATPTRASAENPKVH
jgi:hypothetical protein